MKPADIVELIKQGKPALLAALTDRQAALIVRNVLAQISKSVEDTSEGVVKVAGLGNFRVSQVERDKDGSKVTIKRVIFRPASAPKAAAKND